MGALQKRALDELKSAGASEEEVPRPLYLEFPNVDFDTFEALINYAYTSRYPPPRLFHLSIQGPWL